jgi:glycosyltransferase involved in cell wall biosynthesis/predicted O-methyltransferase YrrM
MKDRESQLGVRHCWLDYDPSFNVERMLNQSDDADRIFRDRKPDLVIFSNGMPVSHLAARRSAIRLCMPFITVEGLAAPYLADMFRPYLSELAQQYSEARAVIAVSEDNLRCLHELFGLPREKGQVILYGRPASFFQSPQASIRSRLRSEWGIPENAVLCFTAGRLHPLKGYHHQLEAIRQLCGSNSWSQLYFAWAGVGQLQEPIRQWVREMGALDHVKLLGQCHVVADWLDAADIFVLPTEAEGMPLAIMEAMAKGLPVMASGVNGIPEELGPSGKLLPDPTKDPKATVATMVQTIQAWAGNPNLRRAVGSACRSRAQAMFGEERMIAETIGVIERTLLPAGDYVSPGLAIVRPDRCFPNMQVGDLQQQTWPYLRRDIPHNWYVDGRWPSIGFLNRDEASILYNSALQFKGRRALEVGCFFGWSACHLALAGVELDVVDPLLAEPGILESVRASLQAAGVLDRVHLHPGASPGKVKEFADTSHGAWSLIFIDGDHDGPAPLRDSEICCQLAAPDAMVLFHDLASPDVAQGLEYFRRQGWQIRVYDTMQIMGVAWRGNVRPIVHRPDPSIRWVTPTHLGQFAPRHVNPAR